MISTTRQPASTREISAWMFISRAFDLIERAVIDAHADTVEWEKMHGEQDEAYEMVYEALYALQQKYADLYFKTMRDARKARS